MRTRIVLAIVVVVIIAAVTAGVVALGSPSQARERRFDHKRVEQLSLIGPAVEAYRRVHTRLPSALSELAGEWDYAAGLVDPTTARPYEYRVIGKETYELCATFQQPSNGGSREWHHGTGRHCFKRQAHRSEQSRGY